MRETIQTTADFRLKRISAVSYSECATPEFPAPTVCFFDGWLYQPEPATASRNQRCQRVQKKNTPCSRREQGVKNSGCGGEEPKPGTPPAPRTEAAQEHKPAIGVPERVHREDGATNLQEKDVGGAVGDETGVFTLFRSQNEVFNLREVGKEFTDLLEFCFGGYLGEFTT